jgi:hypothetical protein
MAEARVAIVPGARGDTAEIMFAIAISSTAPDLV